MTKLGNLVPSFQIEGVEIYRRKAARALAGGAPRRRTSRTSRSSARSTTSCTTPRRCLASRRNPFAIGRRGASWCRADRPVSDVPGTEPGFGRAPHVGIPLCGIGPRALREEVDLRFSLSSSCVVSLLLGQRGLRQLHGFLGRLAFMRFPNPWALEIAMLVLGVLTLLLALVPSWPIITAGHPVRLTALTGSDWDVIGDGSTFPSSSQSLVSQVDYAFARLIAATAILGVLEIVSALRDGRLAFLAPLPAGFVLVLELPSARARDVWICGSALLAVAFAVLVSRRPRGTRAPEA